MGKEQFAMLGSAEVSRIQQAVGKGFGAVGSFVTTTSTTLQTVYQTTGSQGRVRFLGVLQGTAGNCRVKVTVDGTVLHDALIQCSNTGIWHGPKWSGPSAHEGWLFQTAGTYQLSWSPITGAVNNHNWSGFEICFRNSLLIEAAGSGTVTIQVGYYVEKGA